MIEMARCKVDPVYWFNTWVWTYDPRRDTCKRLPMILFPRQAEYIWWRRERYNARQSHVTEKSRDVGLTWLNAGDQLHHWLFEQGYKGTFGSRKEALVDKSGDPDSIFAKLRFILEYLPGWMLPNGFNRKVHDNYLRLSNPANGSTITGEAGDNMGRGGRSSLYDLDEWAFVERADSVDSAVSANSDCIGYTSTAHGQGNNFHRKATQGKLPKFTFHWRDDPRKDDAWYQRQVDTLDAVIVAQEIDIDYSASVEGVLVPRGQVEACKGRPWSTEERGAICIGGDIAEAGSDKCAAVVREGRNLLEIAEWHDPDATLSTNKFIALGLQYEKQLRDGHKLYFFVDTIGVGAFVGGELRKYIKANNKTQWVLVGVKVSETSPDPLCHRKRDAFWWRVKFWFRDKSPCAGTVHDPRQWGQLVDEVSTLTYGMNDSGLIQIISKKALKKDGIKSPNLGDALMATFAWEAMKPAEEEMKTWQRRQLEANRGGWTM